MKMRFETSAGTLLSKDRIGARAAQQPVVMDRLIGWYGTGSEEMARVIASMLRQETRCAASRQAVNPTTPPSGQLRVAERRVSERCAVSHL
jgi:hypothetical protein